MLLVESTAVELLLVGVSVEELLAVVLDTALDVEVELSP